MNHTMDDQNLALISQLYPDVYTQILPQQGAVKPPKRRRKKSKGAVANGDVSNCFFRKRKLSDEQVNMLEMSFGDEHKLESERKDRLAAELGLDPRQVAVWFQNRRARWKNKRLEEEYNKLKISHDNVVGDKCRLESELLQLKEQLYDAEREIQRLAERVERGSSNSPISSSVSVEANETPFFGDYNVGDDGDDYDNLFYPVPENTYIDGVEWANQIVLDTLVKPDHTVVDYRTGVIGLSAEHLENADTLANVQAQLKALFWVDTIMVGHSLITDIKCNGLKFHHARVVDTSLVFKYETVPHKPCLNDLFSLLAFLLSPSRPLVCKYSCKYPYESPEQSLVRMTVTHDEFLFDFMIPFNPKDWVLTGIIESPPRGPVPFRPKVPFDLTKTDMIALCCEKVLCESNTEAAVRVAAVDRNLKVVFDKLVEPDQPVINYRTSITRLNRFTLVQRNASPLADIIQEKLLGLFHMQTIMVGHFLNKDLKALKMDHARVIDTSLVFNYDLSGGGGGGVEKLPRPSLDHLCMSVLGYEMKKSPGRCVHEVVATMKLVLSVLKRDAQTSVPLPEELLKSDESRLLPEEKKPFPMMSADVTTPRWCRPSWKGVSGSF